MELKSTASLATAFFKRYMKVETVYADYNQKNGVYDATIVINKPTIDILMSHSKNSIFIKHITCQFLEPV